MPKAHWAIAFGHSERDRYPMNQERADDAKGDESLKQRLREEMRKYLQVSVYLFICFGALLFYKATLLEEAGVRFLPLGVACVKALIVGKFLLIGDAIHSRTHARHGRLARRIATKVLWLLLVLLLLTIAEELLVGWVHGRSLVEMESDFHARSMPELIAEVLLVGLILVPMVGWAELRQAVSADEPGTRSPSARDAATPRGRHDAGSGGTA
jgi:hypothetical protein